jgi:hypothetical protein
MFTADSALLVIDFPSGNRFSVSPSRSTYADIKQIVFLSTIHDMLLKQLREKLFFIFKFLCQYKEIAHCNAPSLKTITVIHCHNKVLPTFVCKNIGTSLLLFRKKEVNYNPKYTLVYNFKQLKTRNNFRSKYICIRIFFDGIICTYERYFSFIF